MSHLFIKLYNNFIMVFYKGPIGLIIIIELIK